MLGWSGRSRIAFLEPFTPRLPRAIWDNSSYQQALDHTELYAPLRKSFEDFKTFEDMLDSQDMWSPAMRAMSDKKSATRESNAPPRHAKQTAADRQRLARERRWL
jgi:hypothetical protein